VPIAIGIISFYALAVVSVSFFVTRWIGQRTWRLLHYSTFGLLLLAMVHSIWAGTDSESVAVRLYYLTLGAALLFMVFYRILASRSAARRRAPPLDVRGVS
jgi:DMSO/TMAO reductase YedYZ heme-binding membrane subunit